MAAPPAHATLVPAPMEELLQSIARCRSCAPHLAHEPRPVVVADPRARILVVGQAPGRRVHACGRPWWDPSGNTLRQWLGVGESDFYDPALFALMPMGFCYPGKGRSGDLPPRPECAPLWHGVLRARMPGIRLTLLVGRYAHEHYLGADAGETLSDTVRGFRAHLPGRFPLPHPSPRNRLWLRRRPWFEEEVLPELRAAVARALERTTA